MRKVEITYTFDPVEDKFHMNNLAKADDLYFCLWDLDQDLRSKIKYGDEGEGTADVYQKVRDKLHELMDEYNIKFE